MTSTGSDSFSVVTGGPVLELQQRIGLIGADGMSVGRRALVTAAVAWLPLGVLAAIDAGLELRTGPTSFLGDLVAHVRFLLAVPLLIVAERVAEARLSLAGRTLLAAELTADAPRGSVDAVRARARRLLDSRVIDLGLVVLAFVSAVLAMRAQNVSLGATWRVGPEGSYTLAGYWYMLVSLPIFLYLVWRWLWRLLVWADLLRGIARLPLRLMASHPDRAGGLGFLDTTPPAFSLIVLAINSVFAAGLALRRLALGESILEQRVVIVALVVLELVIFLAPLLVFLGPLGAVKRRMIHEYGAAASRLAAAFDRGFLRLPSAEEALQRPEPQTLADFGSVLDSVRGMRPLVFGRASVVPLVIAAVLPLLPALALELPLAEIAKKLVQLLL